MKKIFIYYSLTGNGALIAKKIKEHNIDVREVLIKDKLPKNKIGMILTGGFLAGINHKFKLVDFDSNIKKYDEVIIGSPIWNDRLCCAINSVLDKISFDNKKIIFIFYSGSGKSNKATRKVKMMYPKSKIINIKEPKNNIDDIDKIINSL